MADALRYRVSRCLPLRTLPHPLKVSNIAAGVPAQHSQWLQHQRLLKRRQRLFAPGWPQLRDQRLPERLRGGRTQRQGSPPAAAFLAIGAAAA